MKAKLTKEVPVPTDTPSKLSSRIKIDDQNQEVESGDKYASENHPTTIKEAKDESESHKSTEAKKSKISNKFKLKKRKSLIYDKNR